MFLALTTDLIDGIMIIGLISMMSMVVCPVFVWALTCDVADAGHPDPSRLQGKIS